jgi:hypothetical protein
MAQIEKATVPWQGLLAVMTDLVKAWHPPRLKGEVKYRDHLLQVLREQLPTDAKAEKEFRHRGTTVDLWVRWQGFVASDELVFELKVDLKRKTDYDRLVGQIEGMEPGSQKIVVVLIGETDPSLLGRLTERYAKYTQPLGAQSMSIVLVPHET